MATIATLDSIILEKEDLDYESNGGIPIIISSVNALQVLDSYLSTGTGEKKLYKPNPPNSQIGWELSMFLKRPFVQKINELITKQMLITREFRITNDTTLLKGFDFSVNSSNLTVTGASVWLSSFSLGIGIFDANNELRTKCKLSVAEVE